MASSTARLQVSVTGPRPERDPLTQAPKPQRIRILGVPVDAVSMPSALERVRALLRGNVTGTVFAVNPEKVIAARRDTHLMRILSESSLLLPDGIGVVMAARMAGVHSIQRVPGSDLMPAVCRLAAAEGLGVFLFGGKPGIAGRTAEILTKEYPALKIVGTQHGYVAEEAMEELIERINRSGAQVLFVALGSPRQENWMDRYRSRLAVKVCQGVGGTFDAICGDPPRAPVFFQRCNLEWAYRLVTQPKRAHRQLALPLFAARLAGRLLTGRPISSG